MRGGGIPPIMHTFLPIMGVQGMRFLMNHIKRIVCNASRPGWHVYAGKVGQTKPVSGGGEGLACFPVVLWNMCAVELGWAGLGVGWDGLI